MACLAAATASRAAVSLASSAAISAGRVGDALPRIGRPGFDVLQLDETFEFRA